MCAAACVWVHPLVRRADLNSDGFMVSHYNNDVINRQEGEIGLTSLHGRTVQVGDR